MPASVIEIDKNQGNKMRILFSIKENRKLTIFIIACSIALIALIFHSITVIRVLIGNYDKWSFAFTFLIWSIYILFACMICIARKPFLKSIIISLIIFILLMAIHFTAMLFTYPHNTDQVTLLFIFISHLSCGPLWLFSAALFSGLLIEIKKSRCNLALKPIEQNSHLTEDLNTPENNKHDSTSI